jgi:hypothetical protein
MMTMYAFSLRLGGLGVLRVALALHVCLGSLSSIVSSLRVDGPKQELKWPSVICMAWGCLLTLPMFAVLDLTSETRERGSKRGMR